MPLKSDLTISKEKFQPSAVSEKTEKYNEKLISIMEGGPRWYEVGPEKYRQMRWNGETPLPKPVVLESGKDIKLPSRDKGRQIPCRVFKPESGNVKGTFLHIHGGGWVLQSEHYQDTMLKFMADKADLTVISVGYRLAPEDPYPAGNEDCFDVAEYLVDNASSEFGGNLSFMGGDSAGGHLSVLTAFELLDTRPKFAFKGLVLNFGAYDCSGFLPQAHHFDRLLVLDGEIMAKYMEAYLPGKSLEERRDPKISPFYKDLRGLKLPPALFTCGTEDCLLDDTMMMATKWQMNGAEGIVRIYPGAPHGFVFFPPGGCEGTEEALEDIRVFLTERTG
ncbi:Alpha/Beta hydrolase protein [Cryomyces antarcticus]